MCELFAILCIFLHPSLSQFIWYLMALAIIFLRSFLVPLFSLCTTLSSSGSPANLSHALTPLTLWIWDGIGLEGFGAGNFLGASSALVHILSACRAIFSFKHTPCIKHMQNLNPEISFKYLLAFLFPRWMGILLSPSLFIKMASTLPRRQMDFVSSACVHFCTFSNKCVRKYWN